MTGRVASLVKVHLIAISGSPAAERSCCVGAVGGLISINRIVGQTLGATLVAALLARGLGSGPTAPLIAAGLATVAGLCTATRSSRASPPAASHRNRRFRVES